MTHENDELEEFHDDGQTEEKCPSCGARQKWREGRWGTRFLGCSKFPKCRWNSFSNLEQQAVSQEITAPTATEEVPG